MFVFVTMAELTGPEKQVALGQVEDDVTLELLLKRCLERVDKYLPEKDRDIYRHFWFNDRFMPFERRYLRDIASTVNVTLELRPDYYQVELPREAAARHAIDPELNVARLIDILLGFEGAAQCYQLSVRNGATLRDEESLYNQQVLPYHARLSQSETVLVVRRRPQVAIWSAGLMGASAAAGLLVGWIFAHLG